jgi:hypothetical protein
MSTYKSLDLFGSGPHRFAEGRHAQALMSEMFQPSPASGSVYLGLVELEVVVRGRLVAGDDEGLWELVDAASAQVVDPPEPGTLEDGRGRSWEEMSFVGFQPEDRIDRGREHSLGYTARFLRLRVYPQG